MSKQGQFHQLILVHVVDPLDRTASHLSTQDLMFDRSGLVYMVIRRQAVSMRISDFQLNASEVLTVANLHGAMRKKWRRKFGERGIKSQARNRRRELWVPFPDGVFLCQAVGLENDLKPLLCYSSLPLPPRSQNYLLDSLFAELKYDDRIIAYLPSKRVINITHLLQTSNVSLSRLRIFFKNHPGIAKETIEQGDSRIVGTYISFEDANILCNCFGLNFELAQDLLAGDRRTLEESRYRHRGLIKSATATWKPANVDITAPPKTRPSRRCQNTAVHDDRANLKRPRCNQCIEKHKKCDRSDICGCCKTSGLGNLLLDWV